MGRLILETQVGPWVVVEDLPAWAGSTIAAYRIWTRRTIWGWLQRHEWRYRGRNSTVKDLWIASTAGHAPGGQPPERA